MLCERYLDIDISGRGPAFCEMIDAIRRMLASGPEEVIEIIEGPDGLCRVCADFRNGRCVSEQGDESAVRKFDRLIMRELGLSFGDRRTVREINEIVYKRAPLALCRSRCPWRTQCRVFEPDGSRIPDNQ